MAIQELEMELVTLFDFLEEENRRHKLSVERCEARIKEIKKLKMMLLQDIDLQKIDIAKSVLYIKGLRHNFDDGLTKKAINGIAKNDGKIYREYYGVKNYEGFIHQGNDCEYGYGPSHGTIVFSIGLRNPNRQLTEEETECCLYCLNILLDKEKREAILGKEKEEQ